jgi:hypothetical protein
MKGGGEKERKKERKKEGPLKRTHRDDEKEYLFVLVKI